jgi:hypothetical protein
MRTSDTRIPHPRAIPQRLTGAVLVVVACGLFYGASWWPDDRFSDVPDRANVHGGVVSAASPARQALTDPTSGQPSALAVRVPVPQPSIAVTVPEVRAQDQSVMSSLASSTDEYRTDIYEKELLSGDSLAHTIMRTHGLPAEHSSAGQSPTRAPSQVTVTGQSNGKTTVTGMDR